MNKLMMNKSKQTGIGLLELMLSLAIIAVLLIMATRYYSSASQSQKSNQAIEAVHAVYAAVESYRSSDASAKPELTALVTDGFLPQGYNTPASQNPWGGNLTLNYATTNQPTVILEGIPNAICLKVAARITSSLHTGQTAACSSTTLTVQY